jgi:hypothetical protein
VAPMITDTTCDLSMSTLEVLAAPSWEPSLYVIEIEDSMSTLEVVAEFSATLFGELEKYSSAGTSVITRSPWSTN